MSNELIKQHLQESKQILDQFVNTPSTIEKIASAAHIMVQCINNGGKIISCGNGGSMCDAMHFAEELSGRFRKDRPALPAIAISDPSHITCVSNDYGFEYAFSRFVEAMGKPGDVLLAISTSGNSPNILQAVEAARNKKMHVIGLTGKDGGKLSTLCHTEIRAPHSQYADRAQEIHGKVIHCLIASIEASLNF